MPIVDVDGGEFVGQAGQQLLPLLGIVDIILFLLLLLLPLFVWGRPRASHGARHRDGLLVLVEDQLVEITPHDGPFYNSFLGDAVVGVVLDGEEARSVNRIGDSGPIPFGFIECTQRASDEEPDVIDGKAPPGYRLPVLRVLDLAAYVRGRLRFRRRCFGFGCLLGLRRCLRLSFSLVFVLV